MKQKYCPYCDQKMKTIHYCQECRRIVWQPYEQSVDYYLNERHPQSEKDCLYHDGTEHLDDVGKTKPNVPRQSTTRSNSQRTSTQWTNAAGSRTSKPNVPRSNTAAAGSRQRTSTYQQSTYQTMGRSYTTDRNSTKKKKNPFSVFIIVIALCVAFNILGTLLMVGRSAWYSISDIFSDHNSPSETASSYQELTDEEAKEIGVACNTQGHYDVDLEEAASVLQDALNATGYSWSMYPYSYNETDGEYNWYQTEYDYHVDTDDGSANGTTIEICADTATGQLHGVYIWSEDEDHFLDMADITVETMKNLGLLPGAPEGRVLYAESLDHNAYESSEPQYDAEIVGEQGGGSDYYQLRIMAPEE